MTRDWYPLRLAEIRIWHRNFSLNATADGLSFGLIPADIAQIALDAAAVETIVLSGIEAERYRQAVAAYQKQLLEGTAEGPAPQPPVPPVAPSLAPGTLNGIRRRTRRFVRRMKASAGYSSNVGERYGIVMPQRPEPNPPKLRAEARSPFQVRLLVSKRGYPVAMIESRRGGGLWEMIGFAQVREFVDARPPLVEGQPELREYRAQGMIRNQRSGVPGAAVSAVAGP